jgi:hypothetical protein
LEPGERWQGTPQPLGAMAVLAAAAALVAFGARAPDVVEAQRIDLVNAKGERQATLTADTSGALLTVFDAKGRAIGALRLNGEPRLTVLTGNGREVAGLGAPRTQHLVE